MKFRTSYGQNALKHSVEVAHLSGLMAGELGEDVKLAKRAGLLHDIGKSIDHEIEGSHVSIGVDLCKKYKENHVVINTVASHHGDCEAESLTKLEEIANGFDGVERSFAIQAGREIRITVVPEKISDSDMILLAREISKQIEDELEYPGQIKVSLLRESRVTDYAK